MSGILIITPAPPRSRAGNRVTANRWAKMLRSLGQRVTIDQRLDGQASDLLIALHARKSAAALRSFAEQYPDKPTVLALTGTDLYRDLRTSKRAQQSLELASRLVLLQPHGQTHLPHRLHEKVRVIYQSAERPTKQPRPLKSVFEICVSGHLRTVKDPFRAALAARHLPADSNMRITHIGGALTSSMETRAIAEMDRNPRYRWLGEVSPSSARRILARSRLLVVSSKMEGGANVICEALAASVPVLASRISGSIGLLGEDYPGYFSVGNTAELSELMYRSENDAKFYRVLKTRCRQRSQLVKPERERSAWKNLLNELANVRQPKLARSTTP